MATPVTPRTCGGCIACCKALEVFEGNFRKAAGEWCPHCAVGRGCGIYRDRPLVCEAFRCEWLKGWGGENERPDRTKVIPDFHKEGLFLDGILQMWEVAEGALERPFARRTTREVLSRGIVVAHLRLSGKKFLFVPPGDALPDEVLKALKEERIELAIL